MYKLPSVLICVLALFLSCSSSPAPKDKLAVTDLKAEYGVETPKTPLMNETKGNRFTMAENNIITDYQTELEWFVGPDRATSWDEAKQWVAGLKLDGAGWRMPTIEELKGLYEKGVGTRNINPVFAMNGWWVWTGEAIGSLSALDFEFDSGLENSKNRELPSLHRSFAVRSLSDKPNMDGQKNRKGENTNEWKRFTKAPNSIITDHQTGLEWFVGPDRNMSWEEGEQWVASLTIGGGGWHMPKMDDLKHLYQDGVGSLNMDSVFETTGGYVWSGETLDSLSAFLLNFHNGIFYYGLDYNSHKLDSSFKTRVFAVRSNQQQKRTLSMAEDRDTEIGRKWQEPITGMEFMWIPEGCFKMGSPLGEAGRFSSEGPVHEVCLDGFWMAKTEVTNAQYRMFKHDHNSKDYEGLSLDADNQPAVYVSWEDAKGYAKWLSDNSQQSFRLPTEAEWEYACRAGTATVRFWGDDLDDICQYANIADRAAQKQWAHWIVHNCDDGYAVTASVGDFQPNSFGLHDMLGNVWEWCEDVFDKNAYAKHGLNNPVITSGGSYRVVRGGSWALFPRHLRCATRGGSAPDDRDEDLGFRLVYVPSKKTTVGRPSSGTYSDFESTYDSFVPHGELVDERFLSGYEIRLYRSIDDGEASFEILRKGKRIYGEHGIRFYLDSVRTNDAGDNVQSLEMIDLTGNKLPNLIIYEYSGGAHCCYTAKVLELDGMNCGLIATIEGMHREPFFKDVDGDSIPEIIVCDWTFEYFPDSFAQSPAPQVIFKWTNDKYIVDAKLIEIPKPSEEELRIKATKILSDEQWLEKSPPGELFGVALDLIYGGHEDLGWKFINIAWPSSFPKNLKLLTEFNNLLEKSPYWQALKRQRTNRIP